MATSAAAVAPPSSTAKYIATNDDEKGKLDAAETQRVGGTVIDENALLGSLRAGDAARSTKWSAARVTVRLREPSAAALLLLTLPRSLHHSHDAHLE
jgi:hypothetical protein|tara:strand:- start:5875 stop:6165 length:291 start_codon:yes stop_codon:yes gene_type:complete